VLHLRRAKALVSIGAIAFGALGTSFAQPAQNVAPLSVAAARTEVDARLHYDLLLPELERLAAADPSDASRHELVAKVAYALRRLDVAEQHAQEAVNLSSSAERHLLLGRILAAEISTAGMFRKLSIAHRARDEFLAAVMADPHSVRAHLGLMDYYSAAPSVAGGSRDQARREAEEIGKIDPAEGHFARGDLYSDQSQYGAAEREYRAGQTQTPRSAKSYIKLGVLLLAQDRAAEADGQFQQALAIDGNALIACFYLGRYRLLGNEALADAERYFQAYLTRWPEDGDPSLGAAHWRLGQVYDKQGRHSLAVAQWTEALKLDPDLKEARDALRMAR
jgi:tetratricopeptide (TPR) repeat protein